MSSYTSLTLYLKGHCTAILCASRGKIGDRKWCLTGVQAELLLGLLERRAGRSEEESASASYLAENLTYDHSRPGGSLLSDESQKAVMMQWEGPIMQAHARAICSQGGSVLNIGFGLGLIDTVSTIHPMVFLSPVYLANRMQY